MDVCHHGSVVMHGEGVGYVYAPSDTEDIYHNARRLLAIIYPKCPPLLLMTLSSARWRSRRIRVFE
jgi:hypothetical protein